MHMGSGCEGGEKKVPRSPRGRTEGGQDGVSCQEIDVSFIESPFKSKVDIIKAWLAHCRLAPSGTPPSRGPPHERRLCSLRNLLGILLSCNLNTRGSPRKKCVHTDHVRCLASN